MYDVSYLIFHNVMYVNGIIQRLINNYHNDKNISGAVHSDTRKKKLWE